MAKVSKRRHKDDAATFKELNLKQQSSSIKATIMNLKNAILAHARKADREHGLGDPTLRNGIKQIRNLEKSLKDQLT